MFIQTESTPNPNSLKFIADINIAGSSPREYKNKKQAEKESPLAAELMTIDGVKSVFLGLDFVTVNKSDKCNWEDIKTEILATITDFLTCQKPIINQDTDNKEKEIEAEDSQIVKQIKELIEIKVRPAVAMDGGDIIYHDFRDGIVFLELKGSCSGCPSSTITLKNGIENMLKHYIPEVVAVEQIPSEEY